MKVIIDNLKDGVYFFDFGNHGCMVWDKVEAFKIGLALFVSDKIDLIEFNKIEL